MEDKKHDQKNIPDEQMMKEQEKKILKNRSNNRKKIVIWSVIIALIIILLATLLIVFLLPNEIRVILNSNIDNVNLTGQGEYKEGEEVTISAPEMPGYRFIGWEHDGEIVSIERDYSFKLTDEQESSFVATYAELYSITISSNIVGGTITANVVEAIQGEKVTLSVSEDLGYALVSISLNGAESEIVDEGDGNWSFTMGNSNVTVLADFITVHTVTVDSALDSAIVSGTGSFRAGEEATISVGEVDGYRFMGWEHSGEIVSTDLEYTFEVTNSTAGNYTATFSELFDILISDSITNGSVTADKSEAILGEEVTLTVTANSGYRIERVYVVENSIEREIAPVENEYSFIMTNADTTISAEFIAEYTITLDSDLDSAVLAGADIYAQGESVTISVGEVDGYIFMGWDHSGEIVSTDLEYTFEVTNATAGNYTATFSELFDILISDSITNGSVTADKSEAILGEKVTLTVTPNTDYSITRVWYEENDQQTDIPASEGEYTFAMIAQNILIFATFTLDSGIDRVDEEGNPDPEGEYVLFGMYPQTIKSADVTVSDQPNEDGYYTGSDGALYAQVTIEFDVAGYESVNMLGNFSDGTTPVQDATYYFKLEPLRWRVLSEDPDGTLLIVCDTAVDMQIYQPYYTRTNLGDGNYYYATNEAGEIIYDTDGNPVYANNYEYSAIRTWLNAEFYESAFTDQEKEYILTTTVDNSLESTMNEGGQYVCDDTQDKVFLLSLSDVNNTEYGFIDNIEATDMDDINFWDEQKSFQNSDYSIARGATTPSQSYIDEFIKAGLNPEGEYYDEICAILDSSVGGGAAWLRSPSAYGYGNGTYGVIGGGYATPYVGNATYGAVPALQIQLA